MKDKLRVLIITIVQDKECANSNLMDFLGYILQYFSNGRIKLLIVMI